MTILIQNSLIQNLGKDFIIIDLFLNKLMLFHKWCIKLMKSDTNNIQKISIFK